MLLHSYEQELKTANPHRLLIVGAAPFNSGATGIPFMHADWDAMENPSCSGLYVLQSITGKCIHVLAEEQRGLNRSPTEFASLLLRYSGVGFINASYSSNNTTRTEIKKCWEDVNRSIVESAVARGAVVLLCGEAKEIQPEIARCEPIVHPDVRNTNTQEKYANWKPWWYIGRLKSRYGIPEVPPGR
ncbi:MAG TPA: hypothetical protein VNA24_10255 [Hyalangium sp.]|nr:hypothetical protein [Hyalangium sp.]